MNAYPANGTSTSHRAWIAASEKPFFFAPAWKSTKFFASSSAFFLPITRRRMSASPSEYPAMIWAAFCTCSW